VTERITLKGETLAEVFYFNRLKPCFTKPSGHDTPITYIDQLRKAMQMSKTDQQPEQSIQFTDEHGISLPEVTSDRVVFVSQSDPVDLTPRINCCNANN
jgi:hypothetical protein